VTRWLRGINHLLPGDAHSPVILSGGGLFFYDAVLDMMESVSYTVRMRTRNTTFRADVLDAALHDRKVSIVARKGGVSRQALWGFRRGLYSPSREIADRLAEALGLHPSDLFS
jgi:hypothetical protein